MKRITEACLLFFALAAAVSAIPKFHPAEFPPRFKGPCLIEAVLRHFSNLAKPKCISLLQYAPEQCLSSDRCWCVHKDTGAPRTSYPHAMGEVDCVKTVGECPANQAYYQCAGCDSRCEDKDISRLCTTDCRKKCSCPRGMYLDGKRCVERDQCPLKRTTIPGEALLSSVTCDPDLNEEYRICAAPCDATCSKPKLPCSLLKSCSKRCTCLNEQVRNDAGVCVNASRCPSPKRVCNATLNELYQSCAPPCDATCADGQLPCSLLKSCNRRCACVDGQVRNDEGACVNANECLAPPPPPPDCPANQIYSDCAGCDITCENKDTPLLCTFECKQKCTCPSGMVLDGERCVEIDECPPPLPVCNSTLNEVFWPCAPPCDATCADGQLPCSLLESCNRRCACVDGQVRNDEGVCVNANECLAPPPPPPDCPTGMDYSTCASACPPTCGDPIPKCVRLCVRACECPRGQVRMSEDDVTCVPIESCPTPHTCFYKRAIITPSYLIRCDKDGNFDPIQCTDPDTCWCVNEMGVYIPETDGTYEMLTELNVCFSAKTCILDPAMEWHSCVPSCVATCTDKQPLCNYTEVPCRLGSGCSCKEGYYVDESTGACVVESNCTPLTGCDDSLGEVYYDFLPACSTATCYSDSLADCDYSIEARPGCACPPDEVRSDNGTCVLIDDCVDNYTGSGEMENPSRLLTKCEGNMLKYMSPSIQDAFVPECDADGNFHAKQCYGFLSICWCVNKMTGEELTNTNAHQFVHDIDCEGINNGTVPIPDTPQPTSDYYYGLG